MVPNCFPATQWTQVIGAIQSGDGEVAWGALVEFCNRYRSAIVQFFLRRGCTPEQAEEYTQSFFLSRILARWEDRSGFLHNVQRKEDKRFRSFLCRLLWCFLKDQWKAERSGKAGGSFPHVSLDDANPLECGDPKALDSFGREFDRVFALEIIRQAAARSKHSEYLQAHLRGELAQEAAARAMGISENAFKQAYHRFRERLAKSLWEEVGKLAGPDDREIRAEIAYLMSLFAESAA
jgi:DNA-directed RNA polymerase specialized sigma24 family protein